MLFCGKMQEQVRKLIAAPVCICDECVELCNEIIEEELTESAGRFSSVPKLRKSRLYLTNT